ncbi:MAG: endonuclease V [Crenarchaeota archaeon]|nr:endonuclease V [Thermoproteota archaeon]
MRFSAERARELQRELAEKVVLEDCFSEAELLGGLDVSYRKGVGVSVLSVVERSTLKLVKSYYVRAEVPIPYVPGLLAFREAPLHLALLKEVKGYDVVLVDGHGIAHPRGLGIASHVGVAAGVPTIGVAKRRLAGEEAECGGRRCLKIGGRTVAYVLGEGRRKLYVSPGHCVSLESAYEIVRSVTKGRLPEPIRLSDSISRALTRSL